MIHPTSSRIASRHRHAASGYASARLVAVVVGTTAPAVGRPAPRPAPRQVASGLQGIACDGVPLRDPAPARAALAAFTAGDGFAPGQIIDRAI
jgi:hypothetical protein